MDDTGQLLRDYSETGSELAFRELVGRYVDLVYSVAFRRTGGDPHLAQDVVQTVFADLACKARSLKGETLLGGWLHRHTCFVSSTVMRGERRRQQREREAIEMNTLLQSGDSSWDDLAPALDEAINELDSADRQAVLLRFFEKRDLRSIGTALGTSEDAAQKRVSRALDKLRVLLGKRGVSLSLAALATFLGSRAVLAAPAGLTQSLAIAAMAKAAGTVTVSSLIVNSIKFMARLHMKTSVVAGVGLLIAINLGLYIYNQSRRPILKAPTPPANGQQAIAATKSANTSKANVARRSSYAADLAMIATIANLRAILNEPWPTRRRPDQKIRDALASFGSNRKAAVPILLEALKSSGSEAQASAAFGLQELGTDAAEALPDLMELLRANRLAGLNDEMVSLFAAINPNSEWIPALIDVMKQPGVRGRGYVSDLIATLIQKNPGSETIYESSLSALLQDADPDTRLCAACSLARFPGQKETSAIPELVNSLNLSALKDPHFYDPKFDPGSTTTFSREGERLQDGLRRIQAIGGLSSFGADAKTAIPALEDVVENTTETRLREAALEAIGTIDPEKRASKPEIDQLLTTRESGQSLAQRISANQASFEDLMQGLRYQESVSAASRAIAKLEPEALAAALPALREALATFGAYDTSQAIKQSDPQLLVAALKQPKAAYEAVEALGELGPEAKYALPALYEVMESGPNENRYAIENAIERIDPSAPQALFHFNDLNPAVTALMQASEGIGGVVESRILDVYVSHGQDLNNMTRGEVITFANAVRDVDRGMYNLFVGKLVGANPSLDGVLNTER